jgi:predicted HD phosphohydrolase
MSAAESEVFLALPHARQALALRRADDAAKVRGLAVPKLDAYRELIGSFWR